MKKVIVSLTLALLAVTASLRADNTTVKPVADKKTVAKSSCCEDGCCKSSCNHHPVLMSPRAAAAAGK